MAVFSSLADKLQETFKKLTGKGKLTEADINEAMRTVRMALLEADVSYKVVKDFVATVKERALGAPTGYQNCAGGAHRVDGLGAG